MTEAGETPTLRPTEPDPQQALPFAAVIGGRAAVRGMRLDHDPQRQLLQVRQLRRDQRLQLVRKVGWASARAGLQSRFRNQRREAGDNISGPRG